MDTTAVTELKFHKGPAERDTITRVSVFGIFTQGFALQVAPVVHVGLVLRWKRWRTSPGAGEACKCARLPKGPSETPAKFTGLWALLSYFLTQETAKSP